LPENEFAIVVCFEDSTRERFLLARHRTRGWEIPGGRLKPGEAPLAAAVREFQEETGHDLVRPELLLTQDRTHGRCHVVTGLWGTALADWDRPAKEAIRELRFVRRLDEVSPLAFPDDPYDEIGAALGRALR
jgi:8-oxo-dGTP pyrophosphatase MutT (NUDIX family)